MKQAKSTTRFKRVIQGMYMRADKRLAKRLKAKGKHKEADAAAARVRRHREMVAAE